MMVRAVAESMEISPFQLITGRKAVKGWPSGTAKDSEDILDFSALADITPKIETYPLE